MPSAPAETLKEISALGTVTVLFHECVVCGPQRSRRRVLEKGLVERDGKEGCTVRKEDESVL